MPTDFQHTAWLGLFMAHKASRGLKPRTLADYRERIDMFLATAPEDVRELSEEHLLLWTAGLQRRGIKPGAINSYQRPVWTYLAWLYKRHAIDVDLSRLVDKVRVTNVKRRTATESDRDDMLRVARDRAENAARNAAVIQVMYWTGARVEELSRVLLADYNPKTGTMKLLGKGDKARTVGVGLEARLALEEYLVGERGRAPGPLFRARGGLAMSRNAMRLMLYSVAKGAKVTVSAHDFRRSCAARMRRDGVDVDAVRLQLGHETIAMTMVYAAIGEEEGALLQYHEWDAGVRRLRRNG